MTDKDKIKEKVDKITSVNFQINDCPLEIFQRFQGYCREHTKNNYSIGLSNLLSVAETNAKEVMVWEKIMELQDRILALENKPSTDRPRIKTMGPKKDKKGD